MTRTFLPHALRLGLAALLGFALTACDAVAQLSGPTHEFVLQADMAMAEARTIEGETTEDTVRHSMEIAEARLDAMGVHVHRTEYLPEGRVMIQTSGGHGAPEVFAAVGTRAELSFRAVNDEVSLVDLEAGRAPAGTEILPLADGFERIAVRRFGGIRGDRVTAARPGIDAMTGEPIISITFDAQGGERFAQMSRDNIGRRIAIVLDDEVIMAPIINEPVLGGEVQVSGGFEGDEANQLAIMLQAGELPVTFEVLEERTPE